MNKKISILFIFLFSTLMGHEMTLSEKVGQLLMVHFRGEEAGLDAQTLIQEVHVGGIIYYNWANGLHSPSQVQKLSASLQQLASIPLLIAVDQEGGRVNRLQNGFTIFPSNQEIAMTGDPSLAESNAFITGKELLSVGVNMNLAPVVDINSNPQNPVIGSRSFGETPFIVISFAKRALLGYHKAGIITSLKHFPGHGDVGKDSHHELPILKKSKEELLKTELRPFKELASQADTIMTAHLLVPALDEKNCTTLSKSSLDILRNEMHFQGVIISDSLVMEALLQNSLSIEEAAIDAINAGCDLLILGGKQLIGTHADLELKVSDVQKIHQALLQAVQSGRLSEERLNDALNRVLQLKTRFKLSSRSVNPSYSP